MEKLDSRQRWLLKEAQRRYILFHKGEPLNQAWTGLGSYTQYKPVIDGGYMTYATSPNPGYTTWFRLTDKGTAIIQKWLDEEEF